MSMLKNKVSQNAEEVESSSSISFLILWCITKTYLIQVHFYIFVTLFDNIRLLYHWKFSPNVNIIVAKCIYVGASCKSPSENSQSNKALKRFSYVKQKRISQTWVTAERNKWNKFSSSTCFLP